MKQFLPQRVRVEKNVIVRIARVLAGKGTISVSVNQEVKPSDIIGTSNVSSGFRILNLATLLEVSPADVEKYLKRDLGQRIYKGELLAYKQGGIFGGKKTVIAPTDGLLDFLNLQSGELKMTLLPKKSDLPAGVFGIVESIDKERGKVTIIAQASRIYGMFGSGKLRDGTLEVLSKRESLVDNSFISPKSEGHILVGGSLIYKDAISESISCGINGIITGGINAKDYMAMAGGRLAFPKKLENDIGISMVVTEGFGSIPIGLDIYEFLSQYNNRFVSIDGDRGIIDLPSYEERSMVRVRNTKLPPALDDINLEQTGKVTELQPGVYVRVVGSSYAGEQGSVVAIDESMTLLPSGLSSNLVTIETKRRKIKIPVVNLEKIDYID